MSGYREKVVFEDDKFIILECQKQGFEPYWELRTKHRFFKWKYTKFHKWSCYKYRLENYIKLWYDFEKFNS